MPRRTSLVILGARGRMGQRLSRDFAQAGFSVAGFDLPLDRARLHAAVAAARFVVLAVPVAAVTEATALVAPALSEDTILMDITSVKVLPLQQMLGATTTPVVGLHPLFGPDTQAPLRVAVVPGRGDEALTAAETLLKDAGYAPFRTTASAHDQAMAYIQGLNFLTTVAYLCATPDLDLTPYLTPSFGRRMEAAAKLVGEDAALFSTLVEANPFSLEAARRFRSYLNLTASGDLELATRKAEAMLWWWRTTTSSGGP